jgi:hypothetical protein
MKLYHNSLNNCYVIIISLFFLCLHSYSKVIDVGPSKIHQQPSYVVNFAADGDTILIEAGVYSNDVAVWRQNNLTIRGVGGKVHLQVRGVHAEGKAIWVIKGNNTTIENIEFSGATVSDHNGAGIRLEGAGLILRSCYFHDNENGILTGTNPNSEIIIENCEFSDNGYGDGLTHNIYIGQVKSFTLRYCYIHHAIIGHNVKSRAQKNLILYNRIMDEVTGTSSYAIDLPNGGLSYLIGNLIQQGLGTDNSLIISYGSEGLINDTNELYMINNTMVNDRSAGAFIRISEGIKKAKIINNIFAGPGTVLIGRGELTSNLTTPDIHKTLSIFAKKPGFKNIANFDYRLVKDSPAINSGTKTGSVHGFNLAPQWHYLHPLKQEKREIIGSIDIGAYEFSGK